MKVDEHGPVIEVTLSKRNLLALLHKVDDPESARTLTRRDRNHVLVVHAETDDEHYHGRPEGGPGRMARPTEKFISANTPCRGEGCGVCVEAN